MTDEPNDIASVAPQNGSGDQPPDSTVKPPSEGNSEGARGARRKPSSRAASGGSERAATPSTRKPPLKKSLEEAFATVALGIAATGDFHCATIVAEKAEELAEAYDQLAKVNPRVKAVLERMLETSAWGAVIMTTASVAIPIAYHHGLYPKRLPPPFTFGFGKPPPPSDEVKREGGGKDDTGNPPS